MSGYLDRINEANDIKKIEPEAYDAHIVDNLVIRPLQER